MNTKIGFACKLLDADTKPIKSCNFKTTTVSALNRLNDQKLQFEKIESLLKHNITALSSLIEHISKLPEPLQMVRIGSSLCPMYTHDLYKWIYQDTTIQNYLSSNLKLIGETARSNSIRLSFHPGQYTVLNSESDDTVIKSVEEIEYHTQLAVWMGYSKWHQNGFCINVHGGSGKQEIAKTKENLSLLSDTARNLISIENDEFSYGINDLLAGDLGIPIVIDLHHEWIKTGLRTAHNDDNIKRVLDTWHGIRPKIHMSISRPELLESSSKTKLRAHADNWYSSDLMDYTLDFSEQFDIMCEFKHKNLASFELFKHLNSN